MRAPFPLALAAAAILAACAAPPAARRPQALPKPAAPAAKEAEPAPPRPPRWKPAPVAADGRPVPGGREHLVRAGHTGLAIAAAYGVSWRRIAEANGLAPDSILRVGQRLFIPTEAVARAAARPGRPPPSPEELAARFRLDIEDLLTGSAEAVPPRPAPPAAQAPGPAPAAPAETGETAVAAKSGPPPAAAVPPLVWPAEGRVILSTFGPKPGGRVNDGVNIRTPRGSPVRAAADGEVVYVGDAIESLGTLVILRHAGGAATVYGHLEEAVVARGERVRQGTPIGRAGATGRVREPQLLFQLRLGHRPVDPLPFLRRG